MKEKVILLPVIFILFFLISFVFVESAYAFSTPEEARDSVLPVNYGYQYIVKAQTCWYYATSNMPLYYNNTQYLRSPSGAQAVVYRTASLTTNEWSLQDGIRVLIQGMQIEYIKYATEDIINNDNGQVVFTKNWDNSEEPGGQITIPLAYLQLGLRHSHPYYLYIRKPDNSIYFAFSSKPFYVNSDTYIHKAEKTAGYFRYNGSSWELPVTMSGYTKILDGVTSDMVLYCNHDLYATNVDNMNTSVNEVVNSSTSEVIRESNPIPGLDDEVIIYSYEYDAGIENLKSLNMRKRSWYHGEIFGQPFAIGASKDIYEVLWETPEVPGLRLEISVQSKFQDKTRRWAKQTYNRPWDGEFYILPEDEKMEISMMVLGKVILTNVWNDVDTGSWYNIPPTELYFRYVIVDSGQKKVKYGNWTRLDFKSGSNGVVEKVREVVTTNETIDPDTGEVIYEDVPVEGNEPVYLGELGGEIDESQSFSTAVDTFDNALNSSISGLQSVGTWLGQVPELIGKLFTFLPPEYILIIGLGITMCIILMIAGR